MTELGTPPIDESSLRRYLLGVPPWLIERYSIVDGHVNLSGWALSADGKPENWRFVVNGRSPDIHRYPLETPALARVFPFCPGSGSAGFLLDFELSETDRQTGQIEIEFVNKYARLAIYDYFNQFIDLNSQLVIPDGDQLFRTQGNRSIDRYKLHGYTTYKRLELALFRHSGRRLEDFKSILDWGCGCGRLTQQLALRLINAAIHGIDIDQPNVEWCREHIHGARFDVVPLCPPTEIANDSYDLVIAISVMTHLDLAMQHAWLGELRRIAKPSSYIVLTTHGESALSRVTSFETVKKTLLLGTDDSTKDNSLNAVINSDTYYRASYHLRHFVRSLFGKYFEVINIIPAGNASMQDIIVLRKPA